MNMKYSIEKSLEGIEISRKNCSSLKGISIVPGLCRANKKNPLNKRDIIWYDANVLAPMIKEGKINDGSNANYDDRKMRYDSSFFSESKLSIKLGHINFLDVIEKKKRTKEEAQELTRLGKEFFNDPYAFFGRNLGVTGIILTSDRKIIIGERQVQKDIDEGLLQGIAGNVDYQENPSVISLEKEMVREINEEAGISPREVANLKILGLFSDPNMNGDDLDFCYLVKINIPQLYFLSEAWKNKVKEREHKKFISIKDYLSLQRMIKEEKIREKPSIIFSTLGALESIIQEDFY